MAIISNSELSIDNTIDNTSVNLIQITEDKLENILVRHISKIQKSREYIGAIGTFVSLACAIFATDFHDVFGIKADVIKGAFFCLFVLSIIYLFCTIVNAFKYKGDVKEIIKEIKGE